jgi:hypothetical protein
LKNGDEDEDDRNAVMPRCAPLSPISSLLFLIVIVVETIDKRAVLQFFILKNDRILRPAAAHSH